MSQRDKTVSWLLRSFPGSTIDATIRHPQQQQKEEPVSVRDLLDIDAESWRPTTNEAHPNPLAGLILEVATLDTEYGPAPSFTIQGDDGNYWRYVALGEVAQKRIASLNPQVGDTLGVKYKGRVPSPTRKEKDGSPTMYHDWRIAVERGSAAVVGVALASACSLSAVGYPVAPGNALASLALEAEEPF